MRRFTLRLTSSFLRGLRKFLWQIIRVHETLVDRVPQLAGAPLVVIPNHLPFDCIGLTIGKIEGNHLLCDV